MAFVFFGCLAHVRRGKKEVLWSAVGCCVFCFVLFFAYDTVAMGEDDNEIRAQTKRR